MKDELVRATRVRYNGVDCWVTDGNTAQLGWGPLGHKDWVIALYVRGEARREMPECKTLDTALEMVMKEGWRVQVKRLSDDLQVIYELIRDVEGL